MFSSPFFLSSQGWFITMCVLSVLLFFLIPFCICLCCPCCFLYQRKKMKKNMERERRLLQQHNQQLAGTETDCPARPPSLPPSLISFVFIRSLFSQRHRRSHGAIPDDRGHGGTARDAATTTILSSAAAAAAAAADSPVWRFPAGAAAAAATATATASVRRGSSSHL